MAYNDWLTINPTSGTGSGTVTATVSSHSGYSTRTKDVKISANVNGVGKEKTVTFTQRGEERAGFATIKADSTIISSRDTIMASEFKTKSSFQFDIENTNADEIQYFVEVVEGNITREELTGILSEPTLVDTQFINVRTELPVTLGSAFDVTNGTTETGKIKTVYSIIGGQYGKYQTYPVHINATRATTSAYTNPSYEEDVAVKYGLAVKHGSSDIISELTSITVRFPAKPSFVVEGGGSISPGASDYPINITTLTGVTWTAEIV